MRTLLLTASLFTLLLVGTFPAQASSGVFARRTAERLQAFCTSPLAMRRPVTCAGFASAVASSRSSRMSRSSSSAGRLLRPSVPSDFSSSSATSSAVLGFDARAPEPVRAQILQLGATTPTLALVRFTTTVEPLQGERLTIRLVDPVTSLDVLQVYAEDGRFLATASRSSTDPTGRTFVAPLSAQTFSIPKGQEASLYVRGILRSFTQGGVSGEVLDLDTITLEATGAWSTSPYIVSSTESLPASQTARGALSLVRSLEENMQSLNTGTNQLLWDFEVAGVVSDGEARLSIVDLLFSLSAQNVSLTNVRVQAADGSASVPCTMTTNTVTCQGIGTVLGAIPTNGSQRLRIYGDILVVGTPTFAYVQLSLNEPGSVTFPGAISWTDGTGAFSWLSIDGPIAVGPRRSL